MKNQSLELELEKPLSWTRTLFSYSMTTIAFLGTAIAIFPLFVILGAIIQKGIKHLKWETLVSLPVPPGVEGLANGFANAIVGTLIMVGIASLLSVPFGVITGIFLAEFAPKSGIKTVIRFIIKILSSVPSIIVGVFAYAVLVLKMKTFSALAGGFALSIIMLPVISLTTEEALKLVPHQYRLGSAALGGGRFQTIIRIILPGCAGAITTGILLAIARAAGETAPLLFTALFTQFWAEDLLEGPMASLPVLIYNYASLPNKTQNELAWTAALVLVALILVINTISRIFTRRKL